MFKRFYEELYKSEAELDKVKQFFEHLKIPKLSEEDMRYVEGPGKRPGTDGIPS